MRIQDQVNHAHLTDENLAFYRAIGVDDLTIYPPPFGHHGDLQTRAEMADYLKDVRRQAENHGLVFTNIALSGPDTVTLAQTERDEKIEQWCEMLRAMGDAGVPTLGYNFKPIGNFRTTSATGRGGAKYSTFDYEEWERTPKEYPDKQIDEASMWANIEYFLTRVIPVADECGVRMALHPDDPPIPVIGGVARIMRSPEAFRRAIEIVPSDYNGIAFCQGCFGEMGADVPEEIRSFGSRGKIFFVDFRNVTGTAERFSETFPDDGDVDMAESMRAYKEVGFPGPMCPDHILRIDGDTAWGHQYWSYAIGHMKGLAQAVGI